MIGAYDIRVRTRKVEYNLHIERNITIIKGNSGTGKTLLVRAIEDYDTQGKRSGIKVTCDKHCCVLKGKNWIRDLEEIKDSIVFIDEGSEFIGTKEFASQIKNTDNYYVIITREDLLCLSYSIHSILELKSNKINGFIYNTQDELYKSSNVSSKPIVTRIITEDEKSGLEFFTKYADKIGNIECKSSYGKDTMYKYIVKSNTTTLLVVDGAAFGPLMDRTVKLISTHQNYILFTPESFEWLLLKADILGNKSINEILNKPYNYIDSSKYFSWENFFFDLMLKETKKSAFIKTYAKGEKLDKAFISKEGINKVIENTGLKYVLNKII